MDNLIYNKLSNNCKLESEEFEYLLKLETPLSYSNLGYCYMNGINVDKNINKAVELYKKGIELGDSHSMNRLGNYYRNIENYEKAIELYNKSIELGNYKALNNLSNYYLYIEKNKQKGLELLQKGVDVGDSSSICNMGYYYYEEKDYDKEIYFYTIAANLEHPRSMYNLGACFYRKQQYEKAIEWLVKAAEFGDSNSILILSDFYTLNQISDEIYETIYNKFKSKYILPDGVREPEPKKKLKNVYNSLDDDCPICYDKLIGTNSMIVVLICGHIYHKNCIKNQLKCPYCKETIIE